MKAIGYLVTILGLVALFSPRTQKNSPLSRRAVWVGVLCIWLGLALIVYKPSNVVKPASNDVKQDQNHPKYSTQPTVDDLSSQLDQVKNLYDQLKTTANSTTDELSWGRWSAQWNQERVRLQDQLEALYPVSTNTDSLDYHGRLLLGITSGLGILWDEYGKSLRGQPIDEVYLNRFEKDFDRDIKAIEMYIKTKKY